MSVNICICIRRYTATLLWLFECQYPQLHAQYLPINITIIFVRQLFQCSDWQWRFGDRKGIQDV